MLISMTGYGNGTMTANGFTVNAEVRSLNNRFFEFSARLPKALQPRENELKELVRSQVSRGKITLSVSIETATEQRPSVDVDVSTAQAYYALLTKLRDAVGLREEIPFSTLLTFSDLFIAGSDTGITDEQWTAVTEAVTAAMRMLVDMRLTEGKQLTTDLRARMDTIDAALERIETLSVGRSDIERARLHERVAQLIAPDRIDNDRLEMEIVLLADKMDITEEIVRFRSHIAYFGEMLATAESEGRKINFLLQEMNRETNTIGSKTYDAEIARLVVGIKEELERVREQVQNVE